MNSQPVMKIYLKSVSNQAQYGKTLTSVTFSESGNGVTVTFNDDTVVSGSILIGADGTRSRAREIAMSSVEKAAVSKFPIWHMNLTVCYRDAAKALYLRHHFPTSYLALSQRSFHAFQSSKYRQPKSRLVPHT